MKTLVFVEATNGELAETSLQAIAAARALGGVEAITTAAVASDLGAGLGMHGVTTEHRLEGALFEDYAPEAWAEGIVQLAGRLQPDLVLACGTERGNEVMAHVGARTNRPMVSNLTELHPGTDDWTLTRIRWGGSLLEEATLDAGMKLATVAPHAFSAAPAPESVTTATIGFTPEVDDRLSRTMVQDRVTLSEGITLATAPVVVSGGRGMGSAENFSMLEELAGLVGGAVGCSRVATNNGWKSHSFQVGQTGTRVAPELYVACGISGAIQHWVGMMASKRVLAINTDPEAPMVTKSDYAVIGDALEVIPAVIEEIKRRRA